MQPRKAPPGYKELAQILRDRIRSGGIGPGKNLPSEETLCQTYDVSRNVVRNAVTELRFEGLVITEHGSGTRVLDPEQRESKTITGPCTIVPRMPSAEERELYGIPKGVPVAEVKTADGEAAIYAGHLHQIDVQCPGSPSEK